jgi:hypothetical protein
LKGKKAEDMGPEKEPAVSKTIPAEIEEDSEILKDQILSLDEGILGEPYVASKEVKLNRSFVVMAFLLCALGVFTAFSGVTKELLSYFSVKYEFIATWRLEDRYWFQALSLRACNNLITPVYMAYMSSVYLVAQCLLSKFKAIKGKVIGYCVHLAIVELYAAYFAWRLWRLEEISFLLRVQYLIICVLPMLVMAVVAFCLFGGKPLFSKKIVPWLIVLAGLTAFFIAFYAYSRSDLFIALSLLAGIMTGKGGWKFGAKKAMIKLAVPVGYLLFYTAICFLCFEDVGRIAACSLFYVVIPLSSGVFAGYWSEREIVKSPLVVVKI